MILANEIRPDKLDDVVGHNKIKNVIRKMLDSNKLFSMIIYGQPGIGKTTFAKIITNNIKIKSFTFNATIDKKEKLKQIVKNINEENKQIYLVIDEIHRMKKDTQDFLLSYVEEGTLIILGLTTENPYFRINEALRSRLHSFELKKINNIEVKEYIYEVCKNQNFSINNEIIDYILEIANYEIRSTLNKIELINNSNISNLEEAKNILGESNINVGNKDSMYDLISALQKSIRGSDVDASIYYLAKLIKLGDLDIILRRLSVIAYEDISFGDPLMGVKMDAVVNTCLRLGLDQCIFPLSQIVIEMALSPKSNSAYMSIKNALKDIENGNDYPLPNNLKYKKEYKYPFNYEYNLVKQRYLPNQINNKYVKLENNNKYEEKLNERMKKINKFLNKR